MRESFTLFSTLVLGVVSLLLSLYCALGVLQASLLFSGERAVRNWQVWGGAAGLFLVLALVLFRAALAMMRRHQGAAGRRARGALPRGGTDGAD